MSRILKAIGLTVMISGVFIGIVEGTRDDPMFALLGTDAGFRWAMALAWIISGMMSGIIFWALGAILERLDAIHQMIGQQTKQREGSSAHKSLGI